jgi:hypothetical protein
MLKLPIFFRMVGTLNDGDVDDDAVVDRVANALRSPLMRPRAGRMEQLRSEVDEVAFDVSGGDSVERHMMFSFVG